MKDLFRRQNVVLLLVTVLSFLAGRMISMISCLGDHQDSFLSTYTAPEVISKVVDLTQQINDQLLFQSLLFQHQHPTFCEPKTKFFIRDKIPHKDGFASEVQYIARLLQSSLSTKRILWITDEWESAYCPKNMSLLGWNCLWQPITNCTESTRKRRDANGHPPPNRTLLDTALNPLTYGLVGNKLRSTETSPWFDGQIYGTRPLLRAPVSFPVKITASLFDVIPHWERANGRFWIRAQIVHFLWKPVPWLQKEIDRRRGHPTDKPFVGIHVRYTDNIPDFMKGFGRNATLTRQLERFWQIANEINSQRNSLRMNPIRDIYVATDHEQVLSWTREKFEGWTIWSQTGNVQRSSTQDRVWFASGRSAAAAAIATDLEALRRADYLIGSFQSNVYRLAAQLNSAWHIRTYSIHSLRHFAVDIEWYEDP